MLKLNHKNLLAWQKSVRIMPLLYAICEKLPKDEKYNFIAQIKRAGLSVSNNIAEGSARRAVADRRHFYVMARASLVEIDNCLEVALELNFLNKTDVVDIETKIGELLKIVTALINSTK